MSVGLQGLEAMRHTLNTTKDKIVRRATKAGINAGLVPLVKAMRAAVNASGASSELKRQARKTLAKRLRRMRGETIGKAGFGVGKQKKLNIQEAAAGLRERGYSMKMAPYKLGGKTATYSVRKRGGKEKNVTSAGVREILKTASGNVGGRGVGISASNIHWFVLGTEERTTKSGRGTGRVRALLAGALKMAAGTAGPAMVEAARRKIEEVLAREVAKVAKKKGV